MVKSSAKVKATFEQLDDRHLLCFAKSYYDYRGRKQSPIQSVTLTPIYFDSCLEKKDILKAPNTPRLIKTHPMLSEELKFFCNIVVSQENDQSNSIKNILPYLLSYLGGLYANFEKSDAELENPVDAQKEPFEDHCWRKLATAIFFEQEQLCWHGVALIKEVDSKTQLYLPEHESWGLDELREAYESDFHRFITMFSIHIKNQSNLFDTICNSICSRRFYWNFHKDIILDYINLNPEPFEKAEKQFRSVTITYNNGVIRRITSTAPDQIFNLNRVIYRPNSTELVVDCRSVMDKIAKADIKLKLSEWIRPYLKYVFGKLDLGYSARTTKHYHISAEFRHFLVSAIAYKSADQNSSDPENIYKAIIQFINHKQKSTDSAPMYAKDGTLIVKSSEKLHLHFTSEAVLYLEEHIQEIKSIASNLLGRKSDARKMMIVSVEQPDSKRGNVETVIPLIRDLVANGIEVELCIGAYRYADGEYAGKVSEEVSLACFVDNTTTHLEFVENIARYFHQNIYLMVAPDNKVTLIHLKTGERNHCGFWTPIESRSPSDLKLDEGYTLLNNNYFGILKFGENEPFLKPNHDYTTVVTRFDSFNLTSRQARIIKFMHEQYQKEIMEITTDVIIRAVELNGDSLKKVFSKQVKGVLTPTEAWNNLIEPLNRGYFRLRL